MELKEEKKKKIQSSKNISCIRGNRRKQKEKFENELKNIKKRFFCEFAIFFFFFCSKINKYLVVWKLCQLWRLLLNEPQNMTCVLLTAHQTTEHLEYV